MATETATAETTLPYCGQCEDDHQSLIAADGAIVCLHGDGITQDATIRDEITGRTYVGTRDGDRWTFPALRGTWWLDDIMHEGEQIFAEIDGEICSFIVASRFNA